MLVLPVGFALACLLALPAAADPAPTGAVNDGTGGPAVPLDREQWVNAAPSIASGVVESVDGGVLVLRPFDPLADTTQFRMFDATPVFDAGAQVSTDAVRPGVEVRVHYAGGGLANAVAVDVLPPGEARRERALFQPVDEDGRVRAPHQDGTIARIDDDTVVLRLWARAGTNTLLRLSDDAIVRMGGRPVDRSALSVGDDVRVYRGQLDSIVGVDVLSPDEARRLKADAARD